MHDGIEAEGAAENAFNKGRKALESAYKVAHPAEASLS